MGKERLKEITLDIIDLEDPLSVGVYISMMSESDIHLFLNYVKSAKYKNMDLYTAAIEFSYDYLASIDYVLPDKKGRRTAKS